MPIAGHIEIVKLAFNSVHHSLHIKERELHGLKRLIVLHGLSPVGGLFDPNSFDSIKKK